MNEVYRFRTIDKLLDDKYQEIEKQAIYFPELAQLNDPMEGLRDMVWHGDEIVWQNFFKHYIICLQRFCSLLCIDGNNNALTSEGIDIFLTIEQMHENEKALLNEIRSSISENTQLDKLIHGIAKHGRRAKFDEVILYLTSVHPDIVRCIFQVYQDKGLMPVFTMPNIKHQPLITKDFFSNIHNYESEVINSYLKSSTDCMQDMALAINKSNKIDNLGFILVDFLGAYLKRTEDLLYPKWYPACFMKNCNNSSVWGHYAENHTGMCLIFNTTGDGGKRCLPLNSTGGSTTNNNGITRTFRNNKNFPLHEINYKEKPPEIDFFRSIGTLPMNTLLTQWYTDDGGNRSICGSQLSDGMTEDEWRKSHWQNFYQTISFKTKDWEYEDETRLILSSVISDAYSNKEARTNTYDFSVLKGIIFGIKTSTKNKIEAINIVQKKCEENDRNNFEFYQAYYCHTNGNIQKRPINLQYFNSRKH